MNDAIKFFNDFQIEPEQKLKVVKKLVVYYLDNFTSRIQMQFRINDE